MSAMPMPNLLYLCLGSYVSSATSVVLIPGFVRFAPVFPLAISEYKFPKSILS